MAENENGDRPKRDAYYDFIGRIELDREGIEQAKRRIRSEQVAADRTQKARPSETRTNNTTRVSPLTLLNAEFDAAEEESGEFYCIKYLLEAIATHTSFNFQDAAAWLSAELESASEYERPAWFSIEYTSADILRREIKREVPVDPREGMGHLQELVARGLEHPRNVIEIGFHLSAIRPFVLRRLADRATVPTAESTQVAALTDKCNTLSSEVERLRNELAAAKTSGARKEPEYLDANHPRYAPELAAAVRAWLAFEEKPGKTPKAALLGWLAENQSSLSADPRERVATVANWKKTGGPPKTPG